MKYQEKTLIRTSELDGSTNLQIDPFDLYALSEEGSSTDYGELSQKWRKLLAKKSGSQSPTKNSNQVPLEYARYTTDIKDRKQVAFEVISGSLAGHEVNQNSLLFLSRFCQFRNRNDNGKLRFFLSSKKLKFIYQF